MLNGERVDPSRVPWRYFVMGDKGSGKSSLISMLRGTYVPENRFLVVKPLELGVNRNVSPGESGIVHTDPNTSSFPGMLESDGKTPESFPRLSSDRGPQFDPGSKAPSVPHLVTRTGKRIQFHEIPSFSCEERSAREATSRTIADQCWYTVPSTENTNKWKEDVRKSALKKEKEIDSFYAKNKGKNLKSTDSEESIEEEEGEEEEEEDDDDLSFSSSAPDGIELMTDLKNLKFDPNDTFQKGQPLFSPGICGIIYVVRANVLFEDCIEVEKKMRLAFETYALWEEEVTGITRIKTESQRTIFEESLDSLLAEEFRIRLRLKALQFKNDISALIQIPALKGIPIKVVFNHDCNVSVVCSENLSEKVYPVGDELPWNVLFYKRLNAAFEMTADPGSLYGAFKLNAIYTTATGNVILNSPDNYAPRKTKASAVPDYVTRYVSDFGDVYSHWKKTVCEGGSLYFEEFKGAANYAPRPFRYFGLFDEFQSTLRYSDKVSALFFPLTGHKVSPPTGPIEGGSNLTELNLSDFISLFNELKSSHTFPLYQEGIRDHVNNRKDRMATASGGIVQKSDIEDKAFGLFTSLCLVWDWLIIHGRNYDFNCQSS